LAQGPSLEVQQCAFVTILVPRGKPSYMVRLSQIVFVVALARVSSQCETGSQEDWKSCFEALSLKADGFKPYPEYTGNLAVEGVVNVTSFIDNESLGQLMTFELQGVDTRCNEPNNSAGPKNSCGIHIHEGTTCEMAGGHLYNTTSLQDDPWLPISYQAGEEDAASDSTGTGIVTGLALEDVYERVVVVHDLSGVRVACAPLRRSTPFEMKDFSRYPGYEGNLTVSGVVNIAGFGEGQILMYRLAGLDQRCNSTDNSQGPKNSCGIHIHEGTTCENAGGHHFNASLAVDPWLTISYGANGGGKAVEFLGTNVRTGLRTSDLKGTVVIHDYTGARVACSMFGIVSSSSDDAQGIILGSSSHHNFPGASSLILYTSMVVLSFHAPVGAS